MGITNVFKDGSSKEVIQQLLKYRPIRKEKDFHKLEPIIISDLYRNTKFLQFFKNVYGNTIIPVLLDWMFTGKNAQ